MKKFLLLMLAMVSLQAFAFGEPCFGSSCGTATTPSRPAAAWVPSTNNTGAYTLNWSATSNTMYYEIFETNGVSSYRRLGQVNSSSGTSYNLSGKTSGNYQYQVRSCNVDMMYGARMCSTFTTSNSISVTVSSGGGSDSGTGDVDNTTAPAAHDNILPIQGQGGVSGGSASYSLPIELPPGRADMQPTVSINYSSSSGYSQLGVGFSLNTGASTISRCARDDLIQ